MEGMGIAYRRRRLGRLGGADDIKAIPTPATALPKRTA
jgi:hypothetical protein